MNMREPIDDVRVRGIKELRTPLELIAEFPVGEAPTRTVAAARRAIHGVLDRTDDRLVVVIGPCSIHDPVAALDYARRLRVERDRHADALEVVMRVYFEKPRTTVGWKGLINDPLLDGSFEINEGLRRARNLLLQIAELGLPAGTEYLDTISPQYVADLVSWGAIGARTTESQNHRELASGLSCPVGFKNGTDGNVKIAIDAISAARRPHHFLSVTKAGRSAIVSTTGNEDCHVILRGGTRPNYDVASVQSTCDELARAGLPPHLMIDFSHANSEKLPENQRKVAAHVGGQIARGERRIVGVMVESHLVAGRQDLGPSLVYGQSITDGCLGWDASVELLDGLADAVRRRRTA